MERCRKEDFTPEKTLTEQLYGDTPRLEDIDEYDDKKNQRRIGEHRHDTKRRTERYGSGIAHKKTCGIDIEPKKSQKRSGNGSAEGRQIDSILQKRNQYERAESGKEYASIETV